MNYLFTYTLAFFLNIPFGYFRNPIAEKVNNRWGRFLIKMVLIHAPIPLVILIRRQMGISAGIWIFLLGVTVCILGQIFGGRVLPRLLVRRKAGKQEAS